MVHTAEICARNVEFLWFLRADGEIHGVELFSQDRQRNVAADRHVALNFYAASSQQIEAALNNSFLELERRNSIHQQSSWPTLPFEDRDGITKLCQFIRARHSARPAADDRNLQSVRWRNTRVGCFVGKGVLVDESFHRADRDRLRARIQNACAFAQSILRTNAAADLRHVAG